MFTHFYKKKLKSIIFRFENRNGMPRRHNKNKNQIFQSVKSSQSVNESKKRRRRKQSYLRWWFFFFNILTLFNRFWRDKMKERNKTILLFCATFWERIHINTFDGPLMPTHRKKKILRATHNRTQKQHSIENTQIDE